MTDTALGRQREMLEQQTYAIGIAMSEDKFNHLVELQKRKLDEMRGELILFILVIYDKY